MTTDPLRAVSTLRTPQNRPADARQTRNHAGGYAFEVDPVQRLRRFLVLGVDGGTYYASARELARENAQVVIDVAQRDPLTLVNEVVAVSTAGRAPRQQPALFALAVAASLSSLEGRRAAFDALPQVARTSTHLFTFLTYARQFRGRGKGLQRAVQRWYLQRSVPALAYQGVKYRQRDGWTHRDVLRLFKPKTEDQARDVLFAWLVGKADIDLDRLMPADDPLRLVEGFERVQRATHARDAAALVADYGLPWEALPDRFVNEAPVWEALLDVGVPSTALMRQLPRLTRLGLLSPLGRRLPGVVAQLTDPDVLRRARVHPLNVLVAQRTYASGRSARGSSSWDPVPQVADALDAAFYAAFPAVVPAGRRTLLGLDVSGSMTMSTVANTPLTPRDASAALALVTVATEASCVVTAFHHELTPLSISPRQRLDDVIRTVSGLPFGRTDCALPMIYAQRHGLEVDTFVIYTDSETWYGRVHPHQALIAYRRATGIDARLAVVGMTANRFTIADPTDPGMLDVVGFDTATPNLLSDFSRGDV